MLLEALGRWIRRESSVIPSHLLSSSNGRRALESAGLRICNGREARGSRSSMPRKISQLRWRKWSRRRRRRLERSERRRVVGSYKIAECDQGEEKEKGKEKKVKHTDGWS